MIENNNEVWKSILGYEGFYEVSNWGSIKSLSRFARNHIERDGGFFTKEKIIKSTPNPKGYLFAKLCKSGIQKTIALHRIVAETFLHNRKLTTNFDVHHRDGNIQNNTVFNLEILTENQHRIKHSFNSVEERSALEKSNFSNFRKEAEEYKQTITPTVDLREEWLPIVGWENKYAVSNLGRIKSFDRYVPHKNKFRFIKGRIIKTYVDQAGYVMVKFCSDSKAKTLAVTRLVAESFISNPNVYPTVHHKDRNKTNNRIDNLEWLSYKEHARKDRMMGKFDSIMGVNGNTNRFSENDIRNIRNMYKSKEFSQTAIAKQYKCFPAVISVIVNYKTWKHI